MFNKGKPYVPPPTRSMGTASAHDDFHDLDDAELEHDSTSAVELPELKAPQSPAASYSHAAEERMAVEDDFDEDAIQVSPYSSQSEVTVEDSDPPVTPQTAAGGWDASTAAPATTGTSTGGSSGGGSGWGSGFGGGSTPSRPSRETTSVLGNGMTFEGDISGVGQLVIEGTVKGDVRVSQVLINEKGTVEGTVHADVLEVHGRVNGAIIAKQVTLHPTSHVEGDITQEQLTVQRGAWFSGRSTQAKRGDTSTED